MELTDAQYELIAPLLPRQRGNVTVDNHQVLNAILYVAEHGCKWRDLPARFGNWHSIYTRMNRWAKKGVLDAVFAELQHQQIVRVRVESVSLDSTIIPVHPDGTGAVKNGPQCVGRSRGGWSTELHLAASDARSAVSFSLSPGQAGDGPAGCQLLQSDLPDAQHVVIDRAYEGDETRQLVLDLEMKPVVPPKQNRASPGATANFCIKPAMRSSDYSGALRNL